MVDVERPWDKLRKLTYGGEDVEAQLATERYRGFLRTFLSGRNYEFAQDIRACRDAGQQAERQGLLTDATADPLFLKVFIEEFNGLFSDKQKGSR